MLARFQGSKKRPPCSDTLGMKLTEVEQDAMRIRMEFDVSPSFANPTGAVQGGFISAMLDEVMSTCVIIDREDCSIPLAHSTIGRPGRA